MKPNYNANAFLLVVSIIFATLGHQVGAESDSTPKKLPCGPGTFYSTSVIPEGDCVGCPEPGQCFREATEDDKNNCDEGCGKPTPPPSVILTGKVTSEATKTTTIIPTTTSSVTSSADVNNQTPSAAAGRSRDKRWISIVIGVTVALGVVVVFIVCFLLYLRWRKQKMEKLNPLPIRCTVSMQDVSSPLGGYIVQETGSPQYSSVPNLPITYC